MICLFSLVGLVMWCHATLLKKFLNSTSHTKLGLENFGRKRKDVVTRMSRSGRLGWIDIKKERPQGMTLLRGS